MLLNTKACFFHDVACAVYVCMFILVCVCVSANVKLDLVLSNLPGILW